MYKVRINGLMFGLSLVIFVCTLLSVVGVGFMFTSSKDKLNYTEVEKGVVIGFVEDRYIDYEYDYPVEKVYYYPEINYSVNGVEYEFTSNVGFGKECNLSLGDEVDILYNKDNPSDAIYGNKIIAFIGLILLLVGLIIGMIFIVVYVKLRGKGYKIIFREYI